MKRKKILLIAAIVLTIASVANAGLVLTVNGFDTSMPIEVKADDDIIIAVAGQTEEQEESYSVTCEIGGKLTPLPEPNSLAEKPKEGDFLFTFEDEETGLAIVNLTVGDVLVYQLVIFEIPNVKTVIFGIDSDTIEMSEPEPKPESEQPTTAPIEPEPPQEDMNKALTHIITQNIYEPPIFVNCPNEANHHRLGEFAIPATAKRGQSTMGKGDYSLFHNLRKLRFQC